MVLGFGCARLLVFFAFALAFFVFFFARRTSPVAFFATYCASEDKRPLFALRFGFAGAAVVAAAVALGAAFAVLFRRDAAIR